MMKTPRKVRFAIALFYASAAFESYAQSSQTSYSSPSGQSNTQVIIETSQPPGSLSVNQSQPSRDVPALDGSGIISMSLIQNPRLLVGGTISGGFDTNPLNLGTEMLSANYSFSPYIGLQASTNRNQLLLQYHPIISRYSSYSGEVMHIASAKVVGSFSPRLNWAAGVSGSHGDDSLRLLEPSQSGASGATPGYGAFLQNAGTVTNLDSNMDLLYDRSARDTVGLHVTNSYNSFTATHQSGSVLGSTFSYDHAVKPNLGLLTYAQGSRYFGDLKCTAVGTGMGVRWQPREDTLLSVKGGPQIDTPGCKSQQGFSYSVSVLRKLPHRSQIFATADRQPVISYLGSGLWQDDISAGYERQIQNTSVLNFDVGYVHSTTLVNTSSYHGTFYEASFTRHLQRTLSLAWTYRSFTGDSGGTGINRNIFQFALSFTPNAKTLVR